MFESEKVPDVVAGITVSGDPGFSPSEVRDALELREGDRFDFREWSRDRDRVQRLYYDRGYYAVHVTPTRKVGDATSKRREVTLDYRILRGPRTELEVIGYPSSARLAEILKSAWNDALLPELLAQDLESATRAYLSEEGYLRPQRRRHVGQLTVGRSARRGARHSRREDHNQATHLRGEPGDFHERTADACE